LIALAFASLCGALPVSAPCSSRARDQNGKTGPAARSRSDVDAVAQNSDRLPHDEESDAQAVAWCGIKAGEGLEDPGHLFAGNSNTRIVHIDPDTRTGVPAAKKDPSPRLCVFDRVTDQIAQGRTKQQAIAQYRDVAGNGAEADALAQRSVCVLAASLPQDLMNAYRSQFEMPRAFLDAQRSQDLLQSCVKPVNRILTGPQTSQFGARSHPKPEQLVSALNDLEWLSKIVTRDSEQHSLEIRDRVRLRGRRHAPGYRWRSIARAERVVRFCRLDMVPYLVHVRFPANGYARTTSARMQASRGFSLEAS
jgi:hypothetical protein